MQYRPEHIDLIDAIQEFLIKEVLPFVKDQDALAYKTLVSWNMLGVVSRELRHGRALLEEDLVLLTKLSGQQIEPAAVSDRELWQKTQTLAKDAAHKIRKNKTMPGGHEWQLAKDILKHNLQISNPRYGAD